MRTRLDPKPANRKNPASGIGWRGECEFNFVSGLFLSAGRLLFFVLPFDTHPNLGGCAGGDLDRHLVLAQCLNGVLEDKESMIDLGPGYFRQRLRHVMAGDRTVQAIAFPCLGLKHDDLAI